MDDLVAGGSFGRPHHQHSAVWRWRSWILEDPSVRSYHWLEPDLVFPYFSSGVTLLSLMMGRGILADPALMHQELKKAVVSLFLPLRRRSCGLGRS